MSIPDLKDCGPLAARERVVTARAELDKRRRAHAQGFLDPGQLRQAVDHVETRVLAGDDAPLLSTETAPWLREEQIGPLAVLLRQAGWRVEVDCGGELVDFDTLPASAICPDVTQVRVLATATIADLGR